MDDMQSRIAARRAEIERNRLAKAAAVDAGDEEERVRERAAAARASAREAAVTQRDAERTGRSIGFGTAGSDTSDIFEGLFGGDKPSAGAEVKEQIAARRAEIEREHAATRAAADARRLEEAAAAETEWATRAREEKARLDLKTPVTATGKDDPARKAAMDRLLGEAVKRRWTSNQKKGVGVTIAAGILLLAVHPVAGAIVLLLGAGMYAGTNSTHRAEAVRKYPDLFESEEPSKGP